MIKTINIPYQITGTKIFFPFKAICSVTDKEFGGEVVIEYYPTKKVLEYCDAEIVVNKLASKDTTAEELAHKVFKEVEKSMEGTPFIRHIVYGVNNIAGCIKQAAFLI